MLVLTIVVAIVAIVTFILSWIIHCTNNTKFMNTDAFTRLLFFSLLSMILLCVILSITNWNLSIIPKIVFIVLAWFSIIFSDDLRSLFLLSSPVLCILLAAWLMVNS